MSMINAEWHRENRMPRNPTEEQRLEWHVGHAINCGCREIPKSSESPFWAKVSKEVKNRKK